MEEKLLHLVTSGDETNFNLAFTLAESIEFDLLGYLRDKFYRHVRLCIDRDLSKEEISKFILFALFKTRACHIKGDEDFAIFSNDMHPLENIKSFAIEDCEINYDVEPHKVFPNIEDLTYYKMPLSVFPQNLLEYKNIETFYFLGMNDGDGETISKVYRTKFPRALKKVSIQHTNISKIPDDLFNCENILSLNLPFNKIREIQKDIICFKNVERLTFNVNDIEEISEHIFQLPNLVNLDVSSNNIKKYPDYEFNNYKYKPEINFNHNSLLKSPPIRKTYLIKNYFYKNDRIR